MKITIDNQVVSYFSLHPAQIAGNPSISKLKHPISFRWPSLLEYLGLGSIAANLPPFDQANPLFNACLETLWNKVEKEVLFHVYDRIFAENLTRIKALPQLNAPYLLQAIQERRRQSSFLAVEKVLSQTLGSYEAAFIEKPSYTIHDLILYLAWDRMCVCMSRLFDYQSADQNYIRGIEVFKECLIESYQHITLQGRTSPGIYRMLESLLFYQMREENLHKHTPTQWTLISRNFQALVPEDKLADVFYIDDAVTVEERPDIEEKTFI